MYFKTVVLLTLATIATVSGYHADDGDGGDDGHAHYKFEYGVHDPHTHDIKSQHEHREGKHLNGGYALKEPDGTHRIVSYKSGPHSGFEAVVERRGHAKHPPVYGKHVKHGGTGGTSYVGVTHWSNQGPAEEGGHGGHGGHGHDGGAYHHGY